MNRRSRRLQLDLDALAAKRAAERAFTASEAELESPPFISKDVQALRENGFKRKNRWANRAVELRASRPCVCRPGRRCAACVEVDVEVLIERQRQRDEECDEGPEVQVIARACIAERAERARRDRCKGHDLLHESEPPPDMLIGGVDRRPEVERYTVWDRLASFDDNRGHSWVRCGGGWRRRGGGS